MAESPRPPLARRVLGLIALAVILGLGARFADRYLNDPDMPRPVDFLAFWAAGRLHVEGNNAYDPAAVRDLQLANRAPDGRAVLIWNPPWTFALLLPFGALPVGAAQGAWLAAQFLLVVGSAGWLWRLYGGDARRRWVAWALALAFAPTLFLLVGGQINGFVLFGLTAFIAATRAGRPVLAGAAVALTAIKPHLSILLAVGLLIDAVRTAYGRRVVLGGLLVGVLACVVATVPNPAVWGQYLNRVSAPGSDLHQGIADWFNPTAGAWVRHFVPGRPFWVQCVPAVVAAAAFGVYWARRETPRRWPEVLPWVVVAGLFVPPYGGYPYDLVLLLVPLAVVAVRLDRAGWEGRRLWAVAAVYAVANAGALAMMVTQAPNEAYVWLLPALAGCIGWADRVARGPEVRAPGSEALDARLTRAPQTVVN